MHRFSKLKFCMQKLRISVSLLGDEESTPLFDESIELAVENGVKSTVCLKQSFCYIINFFKAVWL